MGFGLVPGFAIWLQISFYISKIVIYFSRETIYCGYKYLKIQNVVYFRLFALTRERVYLTAHPLPRLKPVEI